MAGVVIDVVEEERDKRRKSRRLKRACRKIGHFLLSTSGLLLLNAAVMVLGAFIFRHLEQANELAECYNSRHDYRVAENVTLGKLMDMAARLEGVGELSERGEAEVVAYFQDHLKAFALSVMETRFRVTKSCEEMGTEQGDSYGWSFTGALIFALTIVTTIGYGSIAPVTMWGRLVVIAYALVGIPIFMLALANIGEILANLFRVVYSTVCCCGCCLKKSKADPQTPGEVDYVPMRVAHWMLDPVTGKPIPPAEQSVIEPEVDDEDGADDTDDLENELTVPLTVIVVVYFMFILVGAVSFSILEDDWSFLDSFYYSAITATTIGFGDLVPDISLKQGRGVAKTIYIILYVTFSMAAISMCLQLIADEIVAKFNWIGEKLGLRKPDDDDDQCDKSESSADNVDTTL